MERKKTERGYLLFGMPPVGHDLNVNGHILRLFVML